MRIEAFSEAKNPRAPEANEDALLILPGRAYAAIDGVSDRDGTRYDGVLAGRFASTLVRRRLEGSGEISELLADLRDPAEAMEIRVAIKAADVRAEGEAVTLQLVSFKDPAGEQVCAARLCPLLPHGSRERALASVSPSPAWVA